ncbi:hypothetical protein T265_03850 [Opisthorchis viverrini]|uniref:Uncharacterized protein n=1 Tax=Opisthorchis viverrini TaxID=6198 RepID=A0A074ZUM7_OPIVI|nr:hypothetical protein T265_03850 [Opisthorchis viverrini]KER29552.1 hypothetical protein T265_03850 [Opisthorchis viverrini]
MTQSLFTPSECLALLAVFSDACKEVELLSNIGKHNFTSQNRSSGCAQTNQDTLLTELNKIFFQTLLRYEKSRREDYLELPDGTFRKLNEHESIKVKYLQIVSRVASTLRNLLIELDESGTFTTLEKYNNQEQSELDKLATFVGSAAEKEQELARLQEDVQALQMDIQKESVEFAATLRNLKHEFQEVREMAKMVLQYKSKEYTTALHEKMAAKTGNLRELTDKVERVKAVIAQSTRVSEETNCWLYSDITKKVMLSELIPQNDLPLKVSQRLEQIRKQLEDHKALHVKLQEDYETCDNILRVDQREKDAIRLREEYTKRVIMSVIQIQSWWRTMVAVRGIRLRRKRKGKKSAKYKKTTEEDKPTETAT